METANRKYDTDRRLAELEAESQNIIETYLQQVSTNADSPVIITLRNRLKQLRAEQWRLFAA